ncbi:MAG: hypothetical protein K9H49_01110 [Bacteroidales bacterium]|nr:hypothetical protein [Bacteroidales bacterium]MCF8403796.1 hypothetical protein [Bacteroidales bacterium]
MKKALKIFIVAAFLLTAPLFLLAQNPPHPNGGSGPTGGNTPVGGGAPIGGGILIMLVLGFGYAGRKVYDARKRILED